MIDSFHFVTTGTTTTALRHLSSSSTTHEAPPSYVPFMILSIVLLVFGPCLFCGYRCREDLFLFCYKNRRGRRRDPRQQQVPDTQSHSSAITVDTPVVQAPQREQLQRLQRLRLRLQQQQPQHDANDTAENTSSFHKDVIEQSLVSFPYIQDFFKATTTMTTTVTTTVTTTTTTAASGENGDSINDADDKIQVLSSSSSGIQTTAVSRVKQSVPLPLLEQSQQVATEGAAVLNITRAYDLEAPTTTVTTTTTAAATSDETQPTTTPIKTTTTQTRAMMTRTQPAAAATSTLASSTPSCGICLSPFEAGDIICLSNNEHCPHIFHKRCILEWLLKHHECPLCRRIYLGPMAATLAAVAANTPSTTTTTASDR